MVLPVEIFFGMVVPGNFSHHFHFLPLSLDLLTEERDLEMHKSDLTSRPDGTERTGKTTVTKEARNVKFCGMSKKQIS